MNAKNSTKNSAENCAENCNWALVLAAGDGQRLNNLTTDDLGRTTPKQFCSLNGGVSLLQETLYRASAVVARDRIAVVVAEQHQPWWSPLLANLPPCNRIEQPFNRGTANGILLPLLHILNRDPQATLLILPSDHYVGDERALRRTINSGMKLAASGAAEIILLGVEPDQVDIELGYILPEANEGQSVRSVERFVEKPADRVASDLLHQGALWNSFIMIVNGQSLLNLYVSRFPDVVRAMIAALTSAPAERARNLQSLYQELPYIDFSRHLIYGAEASLSVISVPPCGWSDLGTPQRVGAAIARLEQKLPRQATSDATFLNLARAYHNLQQAG